MDLDCGDYYTNFTAPAVMEGKIRESYLDNALINLYVVLMRLGYFDGSPAYEKLGKDDVCTKDNIELATEAARQGMVLLKNDHNVLPLSTEKYKKVAAVGPKANANYDMVGNYAGITRISQFGHWPIQAWSELHVSNVESHSYLVE